MSIFDGAHAFTQKKLRKVVKTRRWWWLSWITGSGALKDEELDEDKERLAEFYREAGYIDFELRVVVTPEEGSPQSRRSLCHLRGSAIQGGCH